MKKDFRRAADRMISGKLRKKAGRAGASASTVSVDGTAYAWSHRHGWLVWGKGVKAISVSVALKPERTRELILDFTLKVGAEDPDTSGGSGRTRPAGRHSLGAGGGMGPGVAGPRVPFRDRREPLSTKRDYSRRSRATSRPPLNRSVPTDTGSRNRRGPALPGLKNRTPPRRTESG